MREHAGQGWGGKAGGFLLLVLSLPGCTSGLWQLSAHLPLDSDAAKPVVDVMCLWQAAEGRGLDGLPTRGFAGQLFFFAPGDPTPTSVSGDVRIYLFDDQGTLEEQGQPIHQFEFTDQAWRTHLYDGTFGPTYQVFIPYIRKGSQRAQCSLMVRFTPASGRPIFSDLATITLKGPQAASDALPKREPDAVRLRELKLLRESLVTRPIEPPSSLPAPSGDPPISPSTTSRFRLQPVNKSRIVGTP